MQIIKGAEEYFLSGGKKGIVLVHGYTGAPGELRLLGEYLHKEGWTVLGIRLPGHGTTPQELAETSWRDWYAELEKGVARLQTKCTEVSVAGLSMGGLLTIKAAAEISISKAVILAAPIFVYDKRVPFLSLLKIFIKYIKKRKRTYNVEDEYSYSYDLMPTKPLVGLFQLIKFCREEYLPQIKIPCLILQSKVEHTVKPQSAQYIYDHLGSEDKKIIWYEKSGHIITLDNEREQIFRDIQDFLEK